MIVGGSGFIGTNFAKFLVENDYNFKIYDKKKSKFLPKNVDIILGDIRDKTKLSHAMKDCDVVFHLATVPPSLRLLSREIYDIDVNGTKNVINCAKNIGVEKVVFTSSASHVYGLVKSSSCPIKEDENLNPINEYGENKVISEEVCENANKDGLSTIVLRLSMVLGPFNFDPILIENMMTLFSNKKAIIAGGGKSKNQSVHVEDVISALLSCADASLSNYEVFNISGKEILTINEFMELSKQVIGSSSNVVHLPLFLAKGIVSLAWSLNKSDINPSYLDLMAQDQYFDISKAKKNLNWEPKKSVKDALEDTIKFFRKENIHQNSEKQY